MKYNLYKGAGAKKAVAMALAAAMTVGGTPAAYAADKSQIKDIPNNWAKQAVESAVENDLMTSQELKFLLLLTKFLPQATKPIFHLFPM